MFLPFDSTILLIIPVLILAFWAQSKVKSNYKKYSQISASCNLTGAEVARAILAQNGINDVDVVPEPGELTDHYHPTTKEVHLSEHIYHGRSIAAMSVAAHEVGHAIQHARGYYPVVLRGNLLPVANLGSTLAFPMFFIGFIFSSFSFLMDLGIIFFSGALLFHLVTLPVEFNASFRAIGELESGGYVVIPEEKSSCKKMLGAAAMTYVASTLMALMQLIRLIILRNSRD